MEKNFFEIKGLLEEQAKAFEEFKSVNNRRLDEIEKKGVSDPLTDSHVNKLNDRLDEIKDRMDKLETAAPVGESKELGEVDQYTKDFTSYIMKGVESPLLSEKALSVANDADGGYLVTPAMSNRIITKLFETSPMRQIANVETISTSSLEYVVDNDEAGGGWTSEQGTVSETTTPTVGKKSIAVEEQYALPKATQKFLDDAAVDVEAWLAGKIADKLSRQENTAFITGNGVGKPRGILTYDAGTDWGQIEQISSNSSSAATLESEDFINLLYGLKAPYSVNASFVMNRSTVKSARTLRDSNGNYLWGAGLQAGEPDTLLGKPVYEFTDMPAIGTNSLSVACGDFNKAYSIVDRTGIRVLRDPYTSKPYVSFYTTKRVGGAVANFEAIKLLKMDA